MLPPALLRSIFGRWLKNIWSTHTHHTHAHTLSLSPWGTRIPGCPGYWFYGMPAWSDGTALKWLLSEPTAEANTHIYTEHKNTHIHKTQALKHTWNIIIKATCHAHYIWPFLFFFLPSLSLKKWLTHEVRERLCADRNRKVNQIGLCESVLCLVPSHWIFSHS